MAKLACSIIAGISHVSVYPLNIIIKGSPVPHFLKLQSRCLIFSCQTIQKMLTSKHGYCLFPCQTSSPSALIHMMRQCCRPVLIKPEQLWHEKTKLLSGEISLNDIDHCSGFHPLCDFCSVNAGCPKFQSQVLAIDPDCDAALKELAELKAQESVIQKKKKALEQRVKNTYRAIQGDNTGWLNTLGYRFKVSTMPGRKSFDRDMLHEKLTQHIHDEISVDDILGGCQKTSQPYERLYVSQVNRE